MTDPVPDPSTDTGPVVPTRPEPRPEPVGRLGLWWVCVLGVGIAMFFFATDHVLRGTASISGTCVAAAGLRALAPNDIAGGLVVRRRWLDVAVLLALGVAVFATGLSLDLRSRT